MSVDAGRERGSALVMALAFVVVVGFLVTSMTQGRRYQAEQTVRERASLRALHAAEGGLEQARLRISSDEQYAGEHLEIGGLGVEVQVVRERTGWRVRAIAELSLGGAGRIVREHAEVRLRRSLGLPAVVSWTSSVGAR